MTVSHGFLQHGRLLGEQYHCSNVTAILSVHKKMHLQAFPAYNVHGFSIALTAPKKQFFLRSCNAWLW